MKRLSKGKFAKIIIVCDLLFLFAICVWAMILASLDKDPSATLTPILTVGGSELLLLMIKRLFGDKSE